MNKLISILKISSRTLVIAILGFSAGITAPATAWSGTTLNMPDVPLFVNINAVPNIFMEMDDSGSMDWTILTSMHFTTCLYDNSLGCNDARSERGKLRDYTGDDNIFRDFEYISIANDDAYSNDCTEDNFTDAIEMCSKRDQNDFDWRVRSSALNIIYFNQNANYQPWPGYPAAAFSAARSYPDPAVSDGYNDLKNLNNIVYHHWIDDRGFSGSQPNRTDMTIGPNGIVDQWDSHVRVEVTSGNAACKLISYAPDSSGLNPTETTLSSGDPRCVAAMGGQSIGELTQSIADWYQYFRRRTMIARAGVATVLQDLPGFRYGFGMINDQNLFVEMPDASTSVYTAHNQSLVKTFLEHPQGNETTPLRRGLERIGRYYAGELSGKPTPIIEACQKNFTILFSDGFWNGADPTQVTSDIDGDGAVISSQSVTLADVAKHYYDTDLSTMDNIVPTDPFDTANYQHMVTFSIGFGISGGLVDTDNNGWPNPALGDSDKWYLNGSDDDDRKVDDLWHAAWNSRGQYISAKRPEELISGLRDAIANIGDRIGSAASGSANGGSISNASKIFQAKFDASDWSGELLALNVDPLNGTLGGVAWEAGNLLNSRSAASRNIFTSNGSGSGQTFSVGGLSTTQRDSLDINPDTGVPDGRATDRIKHLRGDSTYEGTGPNDFRERANTLGDLAHSDPAFVGAPPFFYPFDNYQNFASTHKNRAGVVYVGGNDGMLHAFSESTGEELFAYVPAYIIPELNQLTDPSYNHRFYVDGSPTYGDAFVNGSWKSVLVGSLRSGGQALYALDITNPTAFNSNDVLWEFSDADDADMGYYFGKPQIRQMQNGKWAAIFTSGYNNTEVDDYTSATGNAYIYIVYIDAIGGISSTDYVKIPVPGAHGLAEPAVADVDSDAKADFIYVGDLNGKMWKIDVTSSNSTSWAVAFGGQPLFTATTAAGIPQAITTRPAIKRHPLGITSGVLVLFGTGRYLELADDTTTGIATQSVYSIWDRDGYYNGRTLPAIRNNYGDYGFSRTTDLQTQTVTVSGGSRVIDDTNSSSPIWYDVSGDPEDRGWVIDLPEAGERVNREIVLRDDLAFFVTLIPEDDVCSAGGRGWLMAIDSTTGTAPRFPVFDIDGDGDIDEGDQIGDPLDPSIDPVNPIGMGSLSIPNLPAFLFDDRPIDLGGLVTVFPPPVNAPRGCGSQGARAYTYTTQTNGSVTMVTTAAQPLSCGRQNWKQTK